MTVGRNQPYSVARESEQKSEQVEREEREAIARVDALPGTSTS